MRPKSWHRCRSHLRKLGICACAAVQGETGTIPVVFAQVSDPVGTGCVANLARPRGNITGFANFEFTFGV
jgi:putative ABC transport system substrate-binding protein